MLNLPSQIFAGHIPFVEIKNDVAVVRAIMEGKQPERPTHELSLSRGLTDDVWLLIIHCWEKVSSDRPTARGVIDRLELMTKPDDHRPADHVDTSLPSQLSHERMRHPFILLARYDELFGQHQSGDTVTPEEPMTSPDSQCSCPSDL